MRFRFLAALGVLGLVALIPAPVLADNRTPARATAHARDELANAIAQGKITLTPTATATSTPSPTSTPTVTSSPTLEPTETPVPTSWPQPCWMTDADGIVFDEDGAPVPCSLLAAQVLPPDGPPDDGLAVDLSASPPALEPPPADLANPDMPTPTPEVIVIVATAAPASTLPPQVIYVPQSEAALPTPTPSAAQVIYLVVTATPTPATPVPTPAGASLPALEPVSTLVPEPTSAAAPPAEEAASAPAEDVAADDPPSSPPIDDPEPSPPAERFPPPMLASFGLWAGARRRVEQEAPPWLPSLV